MYSNTDICQVLYRSQRHNLTGNLRMIKYRFIVAIALLIASFNITYGCLNGESKILKNGELIYEDSQGNVPFGHDFGGRESYENTMKELDSLYKITGDFDYLSDKGLVLILLKRYKEAIDLYLDIERQAPGRYSTASNIGTAYELVGESEYALKWIRRAVEIDSTSHYNSEWIHVRILEAKIKGDDYITSQHLLDTDFGEQGYPTSSLTEEGLRRLLKAVYYQLNERVSFVEPTDKVVAELMFDLGNIAFLLKDYEDALSDYNLAFKYGYSGKLLNDRMELVQDPIKRIQISIRPAPNRMKNVYILIGSSVLILGALLVGVYVSKRG